MTKMQRLYATGLDALGDREVGFCASTPQLARDGHVLVTKGLNLANFQANPIILWSHIPENPVAVATSIGLQGDNLIGRAEFAPAGVSPLADEVCALVKSGVVKGVSVGFDPIETEPLDPKRPRGGQRILKSELLEISFVSVPADVGASVIARSFASQYIQAIRALPGLPRESIARATAWVEQASASASILSPTMSAWACLQASEDKYSYIQRQAEKAALQRAGRELGLRDPEPQKPSYRKPPNSWAFH